jgi:hypothetical protein
MFGPTIKIDHMKFADCTVYSPIMFFHILLVPFCMFSMLLFNFVNCVFYCFVYVFLLLFLGIFIVMYVPFYVFCFIFLFCISFVCKCLLY